MKTLLLFRHAATNHFEENIDDHEKNLNQEGKKEANNLAIWLKKSLITVDKVLVSTAVRASSTAKILFKEHKNIYSESELYLCDYLTVLNLMKKQEKSINNLAIIGHEPSLSESLKFLVGHARPDLKSIQNNPYPTSGLAIINFNVVSWKKIEQKYGILDAFVTPKYLEGYDEKN